MQSDPDIMTPAQLSAFLQVPLSWPLNKIRQDRTQKSKHPLPYSRLGRYIRFSRKSVEKWIFDQQKRAA